MALDVCFCGRITRPAGRPAGRRVFSDKKIRHAPDCAVAWRRSICLRMSLSPLAPLSDCEKLDALRQLDQFREWRSLDDKRFCLVCGRIITGRQIQVTGGTRGNGPRLSCPTERCNSIPMDWVLPTDESLAVAETMASGEERKVASPTAVDHGGAEHGSASQLKKLAMHFKFAF